MIKYCIGANGKYLGTFEGALPPNATAEVPTMPKHGTDTWNDSVWIADPVRVAGDDKAAAAKRIAEIRLDLIDKLADRAMGTPAEQGAANTAIGLLRAELALEKGKG